MKIDTISTQCEQAVMTHFRLLIEAHEISELAPNPDAIEDSVVDGQTKLMNRERIMRLGERFLQTTLETCEACELFDPENPDPCPNDNVLWFIRATLMK